MSFIIPIIKKTSENNNFREVLYTGQKSQVVCMAIPVGGDIGEEVHAHIEQTLVIVEGEALSILDGVAREVSVGDLVVVTPGTRHNFVNNGHNVLKLYTVYAPVNHIDGRVHATKEDAEADLEDEAIAEKYTE